MSCKKKIEKRKSFIFWKTLFESLPDNIDIYDKLTCLDVFNNLLDERKMYMYKQTAIYFQESLDYFKELVK